MRTFVIGDVHGMLDELRSLVDKLSPESGDRFMFLGDLVDKGPDSLGVVSFVRDLVGRFPGSEVVCGNHEESVMRLWERSTKSGTWDGLRKVEREPWIKLLPSEDLEWLRSLPLVVRPLPGVLLVHGGLFPSFFDKHGEIGEVSPTWHRGGGKRMDRMRRFLRIRQIYKPGSLSPKGKDVSGQMVSLGDEGDNTERWGESYDGREGFVFYGHDPSRDGIRRQPHSMGIDTGCVFGGELTSVVLREGQDPRDGEVISVPGRCFAPWLEAFEAD